MTQDTPRMYQNIQSEKYLLCETGKKRDSEKGQLYPLLWKIYIIFLKTSMYRTFTRERYFQNNWMHNISI